MKRILSLMAVLLSTFIFAQTNVSGTVVDEDNNPIPGANIVFDSTTGAVANFDGEFSLTVKQNPPFELQVSSIGFETATVQVGPNNLVLSITLSESENLLDDVVISASRVPQRLFESPVTIEKFDYKDIANLQELIFIQASRDLRVSKLTVEDYYYKLLVPEVSQQYIMKDLFSSLMVWTMKHLV